MSDDTIKSACFERFDRGTRTMQQATDEIQSVKRELSATNTKIDSLLARLDSAFVLLLGNGDPASGLMYRLECIEQVHERNRRWFERGWKVMVGAVLVVLAWSLACLAGGCAATGDADVVASMAADVTQQATGDSKTAAIGSEHVSTDQQSDITASAADLATIEWTAGRLRVQVGSPKFEASAAAESSDRRTLNASRDSQATSTATAAVWESAREINPVRLTVLARVGPWLVGGGALLIVAGVILVAKFRWWATGGGAAASGLFLIAAAWFPWLVLGLLLVGLGAVGWLIYREMTTDRARAALRTAAAVDAKASDPADALTDAEAIAAKRAADPEYDRAWKAARMAQDAKTPKPAPT